MTNRPLMRLVGSLQDGHVFHCRDSTREAWDLIASYASKEFLRTTFRADNPATDFDALTSYASLRIQQALEFRNAWISGTLLTAPLHAYYGMLNVVRAFLAVKAELTATPRHGLVFVPGSTLFESGARFDNGTAPEFIRDAGVGQLPQNPVSLKDVLVRIPELAQDYRHTFARDSEVLDVRVTTFYDGTLEFAFPSTLSGFRDSWSEWFPQLVSSCELAAEGNTLRTSVEKGSDWRELHKSASEKCYAILDSCLDFRMEAAWYCTRRTPDQVVLPRVAYYYVAMFILGSATRYAPELIRPAASSDALESWILTRFLAKADRYFPQLMLSYAYGGPVYFRGVS